MSRQRNILSSAELSAYPQYSGTISDIAYPTYSGTTNAYAIYGSGGGGTTATGGGSSHYTFPSVPSSNLQAGQFIKLPTKFVPHNKPEQSEVICRDGTKGNNTARPCLGHGGIRTTTTSNISPTAFGEDVITPTGTDTGTDTGETNTAVIPPPQKKNYIIPILIAGALIIGYFGIKKALE